MKQIFSVLENLIYLVTISFSVVISQKGSSKFISEDHVCVIKLPLKITKWMNYEIIFILLNTKFGSITSYAKMFASMSDNFSFRRSYEANYGSLFDIDTC